ncbi:MAG: hypothetical protein B7Y56_10795 [Gallionellales bacterium 35-53-114]|jgi:hypothetical protein|nr:MAG: hypothetical protein B7Y56_10795 [Gallionellales bacterium 35-53-114]OYZ64890.1 MAG: hypothetical protein B7Y04_03805 [Gallionellales bacterium 24-53-125]OZB07572.1 MAG: hypothetical protein B7X61_13210 [Gallionellales bacterium 39-52-133]HQS58748.1 hypothetical protein [Gallionellaceae bacterium]HQS75088.1 hypothetical protein [Gallionellaceae bacterium]
MNIIKTFTLRTDQPDTFRVYWTNSPVRAGGLIKVRIQSKIEDMAIAAELAAMQYLLEDKRVIGTNTVGNSPTRLYVSQGAIRKLQLNKSDKAHLAPYANFLTTRFAGCQMCVEKDSRWFDGFMPETVDELTVNQPKRETICLTGLGDVSVTQHVLQRISDRLLTESKQANSCSAAWKKLNEVASDPLIQEVSRQGIWNTVKYARQNKHEGRYFLNSRRNLILVVTDNPGEGKRLVTAYPANKQFAQMPLAA